MEKEMGEVVGDQIANQAGKFLKKGEKKITSSGTVGLAGLIVFSSLVSSPVCKCLLGTLGAL
jgi:hypothetical protein